MPVRVASILALRGAGAALMACGVGSAASQSVAEGCPRLGSAAALTLRCGPPKACTHHSPNVLIARIAAALGLAFVDCGVALLVSYR